MKRELASLVASRDENRNGMPFVSPTTLVILKDKQDGLWLHQCMRVVITPTFYFVCQFIDPAANISIER